MNKRQRSEKRMRHERRMAALAKRVAREVMTLKEFKKRMEGKRDWDVYEQVVREMHGQNQETSVSYQIGKAQSSGGL